MPSTWMRSSMQAPATKGAKGVCTAAMLLCIGAFALPAEAKTWTVKITAMQFDPAIVTVASGDTVVWVNEDPFQHTVTSSDGQRFDSHAIAPGASWRYEANT